MEPSVVLLRKVHHWTNLCGTKADARLTAYTIALATPEQPAHPSEDRTRRN